jgi:flagellar biosynthesis protein FliP
MSPPRQGRLRWRVALSMAVALFAAPSGLALPAAQSAADESAAAATSPRQGTGAAEGPAHGSSAPNAIAGSDEVRINRPQAPNAPAAPPLSMPDLSSKDTMRTLQNFALFGLISLAPMGLLMVTAFVRINVVLILLRQALGSPQVPGNQILTALALLLTALVMHPIGERVYRKAVLPYSSGQLPAGQAWAAGTQPIKEFMVDQIVGTKHQDYLQALHEYTVPPSPGHVDLAPLRPEEFPLRVVAPAYLLSELTTALLMGFYVYLPFLVIDLVVSAVLAATGLFMLPPALVATPIKLIVFVLADGWLLIASMLLSSFAVASGGP